MDISENVPLSNLTTFRTGGPARFLLIVDTSEIREAVAFAKEKGLPLISIGSGSNMLAPESGSNAIFLRIANNTIDERKKGDSILLTADAGVLWDDLVLYATHHGWWGIENLSAIPGTVGAAAVQNIGAYGAALSEHLVSVDAYDTKEETIKTISKSECAFGYRTSIFKKEADRYIILKVTLSLSKTSAPNISYRDLAKSFADNQTPSLSQVRNAVMAIRKGKFPPLSEFGTAGSFFLNPIVGAREQQELSKRFPDMPFFPLPEGGVKLPLAWILDRALSLKGERRGNAFLWEQQPLVIATTDGASTADVTALADSVAHAVFQKTGITIQPEVRFLGAHEGKKEHHN